MVLHNKIAYITHIIAQNAQKQCIIVKLPERITTLPKVTPQQRIGLCLAQVLGQCLPRKQAVFIRKFG